jgi:Mrp family chromosome partitioning ATPase
MRRFYEGLRNRLIVHFEIWNLKHKPKMVAVTSCGRGAGVSSTAAGLAASLSETGDGSVLLVDMNCERGAAQRFYKGEATSGLEDALTGSPDKSALVHTNLYATGEKPGNDLLPEALPRRFATLVPKFKASEYDFIIFDMPAVSQTSVTARLAGFMDMVLLVIESEKTNRDVVKRANALLAESKANVRAVLNKTRTYVPERLQPKLPDDH